MIGKTNGFQNIRGFSIVGMLVGVSMLGVLTLGLVQFLDYSGRSVRVLEEKLEILALEQDLLRELSDEGICSCNFDPAKNTAHAGVLHFNPDDSDSKIEIPQIFGTCISGVPSNPVFATGSRVGHHPSGPIIGNITLKNFSATGTGLYRGSLEIGFEAQSLKLARRPAAVNLSLVVDASNPTQVVIRSCSTRGAPGGGALASNCPAWTPPRAPTAVFSSPIGTVLFQANYPPYRIVRYTAFQPDCGLFYMCDYSPTDPTVGQWTTIDVACPSDSGNHGGATE